MENVWHLSGAKFKLLSLFISTSYTDFPEPRVWVRGCINFFRNQLFSQ